MRLVYTTHNADWGRTLANFLAGEGIENQLEMVKTEDWGQADYGDTIFNIWVIDEDLAQKADKWIKEFEQDPKNPFFQKTGPQIPTVVPAVVSSGPEEASKRGMKSDEFAAAGKRRRPNEVPFKPEGFRSITTGLLMLCCLIFLISNLTAPQVEKIPKELPAMPVVSSDITKQFLYDYPEAYELVDKLVGLYGLERLESPDSLPVEGKYLLKKFQETPYWQGYYNVIAAYLKDKPENAPKSPMFEKIKEGEIWRLITPCLLHNDFLHILFNMLWLIVLGKQLEQRLSPRRYLLLVIAVGIFSNTCQYLMGGPNFIGFSGIVCGMVGFIWIRQKIAPWEGYPLEQSTTLFITYFVLALLAIQAASFYMEIAHDQSISPGIANTGHVSGAVMGILLGLLPFFKKYTPFGRTKK